MRGFRFDPPAIELPLELNWLLARAFGPIGEADDGAGLRPELVVELAQRFNLDSRVGARTRKVDMAGLLGAPAAQELWRGNIHCSARGIVCEHVTAELARIARRLGVPIILLKGMALRLSMPEAFSKRDLGDIDIVVPEGREQDIASVLLENGCSQSPSPTQGHHLPPITHPDGAGIEVHTSLRGVRLDGRNSATADALFAGGLVERLEGFEGDVFVPTKEVLIAHLLVHGLGQHAPMPETYPMFRLVEDVIDLGMTFEQWQHFFDSWYAWIATDVPIEESEALVALAGALERGEDSRGISAGEDNRALLLRHFIARVEDDAYKQRLREGAFGGFVPVGSKRGTLTRKLWRDLTMTPSEYERGYRYRKQDMSFWCWRLWWFGDVTRRGVSYLVSKVKR